MVIKIVYSHQDQFIIFQLMSDNHFNNYNQNYQVNNGYNQQANPQVYNNFQQNNNGLPPYMNQPNTQKGQYNPYENYEYKGDFYKCNMYCDECGTISECQIRRYYGKKTCCYCLLLIPTLCLFWLPFCCQKCQDY